MQVLPVSLVRTIAFHIYSPMLSECYVFKDAPSTLLHRVRCAPLSGPTHLPPVSLAAWHRPRHAVCLALAHVCRSVAVCAAIAALAVSSHQIGCADLPSAAHRDAGSWHGSGARRRRGSQSVLSNRRQGAAPHARGHQAAPHCGSMCGVSAVPVRPRARVGCRFNVCAMISATSATCIPSR
jgi:hypothetical protein